VIKEKLARKKMQRNKRTVVLAHADLAPLTERILSRMGPEGEVMRTRLKHFLRERALPDAARPRERKEKT
jgi:hypothetical protein